MKCAPLVLGGRQVGFVCGRDAPTMKCTVCGAACRPWILCDWKLTGPKKGKTCSRVMCLGCAREVDPEKHLCPPHAKLWDVHPKNPNRVEGDSLASNPMKLALVLGCVGGPVGREADHLFTIPKRWCDAAIEILRLPVPTSGLRPTIAGETEKERNR